MKRISKLFLTWCLIIVMLSMNISVLYANDATTEYAKYFINNSEGQTWFILEIDDILKRENKSIYSITSKDDLQNIYAIGLNNQNIKGKIPQSIGELSNLEFLFLANNELEGNLPNSLYKLDKLKNIDLSNNNITSSISSNISNLTNLEVILLNNNNFYGEIPPEMVNLANLKNMDLSDNDLEGTIPKNIGNLDSLIFMNLSKNNLTGEIPDSIGSLDNLEVLLLWDNELSGEIPKSIENLTNLESFDVAINNLHGEFFLFNKELNFAYQENDIIVVEKYTEEKEEEKNIEDKEIFDTKDDDENYYDSAVKKPSTHTELVDVKVINDKPKYIFTNEIPYILGYKDKTIKPNNFITRQEFASILNKIIVDEGHNDYTKISGYKDLHSAMWSYDNINFVISKEIMVGNNYEFRPNDNLTRAEFAKIMTDLNEYKIEDGSYFNDVQDGWAKKYIYTVYINGLMEGYNKNFRPNDFITRAEVIKVINQTINMKDIDTKVINNPFIDLDESHWAYKEILKASIKQ